MSCALVDLVASLELEVIVKWIRDLRRLGCAT